MSKFIIVIVSKTNLENIERWEFNIETKDQEETTENGDGDGDGWRNHVKKYKRK